MYSKEMCGCMNQRWCEYLLPRMTDKILAIKVWSGLKAHIFNALEKLPMWVWISLKRMFEYLTYVIHVRAMWMMDFIWHIHLQKDDTISWCVRAKKRKKKRNQHENIDDTTKMMSADKLSYRNGYHHHQLCCRQIMSM